MMIGRVVEVESVFEAGQWCDNFTAPKTQPGPLATDSRLLTRPSPPKPGREG